MGVKLAGMEVTRRAYPSDVTDDEWAFLLTYLLLVCEDAGQRQYPLRELFNALRYVVRTGCPRQYLPHDLPPWATC
jgi:transposase